MLRAIAGGIPEARHATLRPLRLDDGTLLDRGLVLYFPGPASFTGEDCAEFHIHGGRAVVAAALRLLSSFARVRLAEPGEFTRRAFANGKMDLLDIESLSDLIAAETESERRFAIGNGAGRHAALYKAWRQEIVRARAMVEAQLDFGDEDDVSEDSVVGLDHTLADLQARVRHHVDGYRRAEMVSRGLDVVLLGAPNVGKSSLLNALARRDAAIVTEEPGTTRDLVEVVLDLEGEKVRVTDTAGIRTPGGMVERIGIERALERAASARLVLALVPVDGSAEPIEVPGGVDHLLVGTKIDLATRGGFDACYDHLISSRSGQGLPDLLTRLAAMARAERPLAGEVVPWKERHVGLLNETIGCLAKAVETPPGALELKAEALRSASNALGRIAGDVDVEDLLDEIFGTFCIGK